MPFASDVWQPWEVAVRLSDRTDVLVAPPISYGMSLHHMGFPGSLSLRPDTLTQIVVDLLASAYEHGFRRVLLLNGHGGNTAALQVALAEVLNELHGLDVRLGIWWREPAVAAVFEEAFPGQRLSHADAGETSLLLAVRPDTVHLERAEYSPDAPRVAFLTRYNFLEHYPHGVIGGDPRQASAGVGERAIEAAVTAYEEILRGWGSVG
jgi:creatinine amidohydrolase